MYRGYRIEGVKQGEGMLLRVTPTRPTCLCQSIRVFGTYARRGSKP